MNNNNNTISIVS